MKKAMPHPIKEFHSSSWLFTEAKFDAIIKNESNIYKINILLVITYGFCIQ
jgi:hypothetical protein